MEFSAPDEYTRSPEDIITRECLTAIWEGRYNDAVGEFEKAMELSETQQRVPFCSTFCVIDAGLNYSGALRRSLTESLTREDNGEWTKEAIEGFIQLKKLKPNQLKKVFKGIHDFFLEYGREKCCFIPSEVDAFLRQYDWAQFKKKSKVSQTGTSSTD